MKGNDKKKSAFLDEDKWDDMIVSVFKSLSLKEKS